MKKLFTFFLTLAMLLSMAACGSTGTTQPSETEPAQTNDSVSLDDATVAEIPEATEENPEDRVVTVIDMSGDEITITGKVEKIVNLWPAGTSSFFVMGAGDLVTALAINNPGTNNSWSKLFYEGAADITAMGGTTPSIEELVAMDPDLVIIHPSTAKDGFAQQIRDAGIPAININFSDYDSMITAYTMLGEVLGGEYQEKLTAWCNMVLEKQATVEALTADISEEERPVVLYISGQSDSLTTTMGSNSICADWTKIAGGVYATDLLENSNTTEITAEEIFALDPDVIIVGGIYQHKLVDDIQNTDGWKELRAVVNGRVYTNPYGAFNWDRFGLESYFQIVYALMCIQPEIAEANGYTQDALVQNVIDFYAMMNGIEMTTEQAENMIAGLEPDGSMAELTSGGQGGGQGGRG